MKQGGKDNLIMNYGPDRKAKWSDCSSDDFYDYFSRIVQHKSFCLKEDPCETPGQWSPWSACSRSCGSGTQKRTRDYQGGMACPVLQTTQIEPCSSPDCPGFDLLWGALKAIDVGMTFNFGLGWVALRNQFLDSD